MPSRTPRVNTQAAVFSRGWAALYRGLLVVPAVLAAGATSSSASPAVDRMPAPVRSPVASAVSPALGAATQPELRPQPAAAEAAEQIRTARAAIRRSERRPRDRAARFSARMNVAVRRHARQSARLQARHLRWAAAAMADAPALSVRRFDRLVREASRRHAVPADLIRAVVLVESRYDARALSPAGAMGLMQLMPATAAELRVSDAFNARQNVLGGARLLRILGDQFEDPVHAIAAYNAGASAVRRYRGVPPYRETRQYVWRVLGAYQQYRSKHGRAIRRAPHPVRFELARAET